MYKLFTKIILNRISSTLEGQQPKEQAAFRKGYSTSDHLFVINQLLERCREYKIPICLAFIDYEKAFDNVEVNAVLQALKDQGIHPAYVKLLQEANSNCTTDILLTPEINVSIPVEKGVKQGDTISPKLFNACLESTMRTMTLTGGINVNGENLNHRRFADDIVLIATTTTELQQMIQEVEEKSKSVGLKLNRQKTKVLLSEHVPRGSDNNR